MAICQGCGRDLEDVAPYTRPRNGEEMRGSQRGEFTCDCGRWHIIENAAGEMRVYHTEE